MCCISPLLLLDFTLSLLTQLELPQLHLKDQTGVSRDPTLDTLRRGEEERDKYHIDNSSLLEIETSLHCGVIPVSRRQGREE